MERRKRELCASFDALQEEWKSLQTIMNKIVEMNKKSVETINTLDQRSFLNNMQDFLKVSQDQHILTQKIMALNLHLEMSLLENNIVLPPVVVSEDILETVNVNVESETKYSSVPSDVTNELIEEKFSGNSYQAIEANIEYGLQKNEATIVDNSNQDSQSSNESVNDVEKNEENVIAWEECTNVDTETDIPDAVTPVTNDLCIISSFINPQQLYINLAREEGRSLESVTQQLFKCQPVAAYKSKDEARQNIFRYCAVYSAYWTSWFRAEIIDWLSETNPNIKVHLIDFGDYENIPLSGVRNLPRNLYKVPKFAINCRLAHVSRDDFQNQLYPPGSTENNILKSWPRSSLPKSFKQEIHDKIYCLTYLEKNIDFWAIDLVCSEESEDERSLGEQLIDMQAAVEIMFPTREVVKNKFIAEQLKTAQGMGGVTDAASLEKALDDMTLEERGTTIGEAMTGYDATDEARICRFTTKEGTCFKGANCTFEHSQLRKDGYTSDRFVVYTGSLTPLVLPAIGDMVGVTISCASDIREFYVQISDNCEDKALRNLINAMNHSKVSHKPFKLLPAYGEIVVVKTDKLWYRALVTEIESNYGSVDLVVQVFLVDYGDTINVDLQDIRQISEEFMHLPFQAVKCRLENIVVKENIDIVKALEFFEINFLCQKLQCIVIGSDVGLEVQLFDNDSRDIGHILVEEGFAELAYSN